MKFPCELIAQPYITQLRIEAAKYLHKEKGKTQTQIANLLQVSQPVVSNYFKKTPEFEEVPNSIILRAKEIGRKVGELLSQQGSDAIPEAIGISCKECKILRQGGPTCIYHRAMVPQLDEDCDKCWTRDQLIQLQIDKEHLLSQLRQLFERISGYKSINRLIPEIGMQIIAATDEVNDYSDIAGFPGRINKRYNNPPLADSPSFGSSQTTSHLLMLLKEQGSDTRSICTIKNTNWTTSIFEEMDIVTIKTDEFDRDYEKGLEMIEIPSEVPFVIINSGGLGYEGISYLCTSDLMELETQILVLLE